MANNRAAAMMQYSVGEKYHDARDFETAIRHYEAALHADPTYELVYNDIAAALANLGRHGEALKYAKKAFQNQPNHTPTLGNLLGCLYQLERYPEAREYLDDAVARGFDPSRLPIGIVKYIADIYYVTGAHLECIPLFEAVLEQQPDLDECSRAVGSACFSSKQFERALKHYQNARRYKPECPNLCLGMARCYSMMHMPEPASKYLRMARERDPSIDLTGG